jgi:hypothetical protein
MCKEFMSLKARPKMELGIQGMDIFPLTMR